jgi:hypothetical protein
MTSLFQSSEDAHEDGLRLGFVLAAVGVAVLPHDHRRSNLSLGVIVVEGDFGVVQESELFGGMTPRALHQPTPMALLPGPRQKFVPPNVQASP